VSTKPFSQRVNSRKLYLAIGVILFATMLVIGGYISGDNWVNAVSITAGAYMGSQAYVDRREE